MTAQSGLGFSGIVAIQIPDEGATGEVLTKLTPENYDYDWLAGGGGGPTVDPGTVDDSILRWNTVTPAWEEFTSFIFPLTDGLTDQIMSTDGAGVVSWVDPPAGGGLLSAEYRFSTSTVAADPGSGRYRFDTGAYATVTEIFIDDETSGGVDISNLLALVGLGDRLYFQVKSEANKFVVFDVTGPAVDNGGWFTIPVDDVVFGDFFGNNDRCIMIWSVGGTPDTLQTAYNEDTSVPQITINATPDPLTIDASVVGDIFAVRDVANADLVRISTTGSEIVGGSSDADNLTLGANLVLTGDGRILMNSAVEFGSISASSATHAFNYDAVESYTAGFVGGGLAMAGTITFSNSLFIYESFRGAPIINTAVNPGFAAYTVLQALPSLNAGSGAGHNPLNPLVVNAAPVVVSGFVGARTVGTMTIVNGSPQVRATLSGALMNVDATTGFNWAPKFSTVAGSQIGMGIVRGLHGQNITVGLFQPNLGTETMLRYALVDCNDITFGATSERTVVRSSMVAGTNKFFLRNISTAVSSFGAAPIHFDDNAQVQFGNTVGSPDAGIYFDGSNLVLDTQISGANAFKTKVEHGIIVEGDIFPVSDFIRRASSTNLLLSSWRLTGQTSGDMVDGFGTALFWTIEDDAAVKNNIAFFSAEREGADNSGRYRLRVYTAGVAQEIYNAGADGFAHVATNLGFYGTTPIAQQAAPVTLGDVIAVLQNLGLTA